MKGVDFKDEDAGFCIKNLSQMKPLIDGQDENCMILAKNSLVFHNPELLRTLLWAEF